MDVEHSGRIEAVPAEVEIFIARGGVFKLSQKVDLPESLMRLAHFYGRGLKAAVISPPFLLSRRNLLSQVALEPAPQANSPSCFPSSNGAPTRAPFYLQHQGDEQC
jgi:hypothetical protein